MSPAGEGEKTKRICWRAVDMAPTQNKSPAGQPGLGRRPQTKQLPLSAWRCNGPPCAPLRLLSLRPSVPPSSPLPLAGPYLLVNCCFVFPSLPLRARLLLWSFSPAAGSRWLHSQDHDGALPEPLPQLSSPSGVSLAFSTPGVCPPGLAVDLNYLMASFFVAPGPFFSVLDAEQKNIFVVEKCKTKTY